MKASKKATRSKPTRNGYPRCPRAKRFAQGQRAQRPVKVAAVGRARVIETRRCSSPTSIPR